MKDLHARGVHIVDTTCPWVSKVWNAVDNQARKGHTSIIHGKWAHEETVATASFAGAYLIVKDLAEAQAVADYMLHGGDRVAFLTRFRSAHSPGFDPDRDLDCIGMANQTTMLKGETQAIGKLLEGTQLRRFGPQDLAKHFMVMDTICDATQERQDAVFKLTSDQVWLGGVESFFWGGGRGRGSWHGECVDGASMRARACAPSPPRGHHVPPSNHPTHPLTSIRTPTPVPCWCRRMRRLGWTCCSWWAGSTRPTPATCRRLGR